MKTAITNYQINWLTEPSAQAMVADVIEGDVPLTEIPMPPNTGKGWIECLRLSNGLDISHGIHEFDPSFRGQMMPFAEIVADLAEPIVMLQLAKYGQVVLHDRNANKQMLLGSGYTSFHHLDVMNYLPTLNTDEDIEVFVFKASESVLSELVGENFFATFLKQWNIETLPCARTHAIPEHIASILYASLNSPYQGEMRRLHAQAKAIEFICALTHHGTNITEEKISASQRKKAKAIRDELLSLEGKVPSLYELSAQYGMSARTLNSLFKQEFEKTLPTYISEQRLHMAHQTLQESDLSMKVLAARIGYTNVNHFISAFKRLFGYTPGSLRR